MDSTFLADVLHGLASRPKSLPSKYFYDRRGSELFDEITRLEEYYLTRTETQIMEDNIDDIADSLGAGVVIIELGGNDGLRGLPLEITRSNLSSMIE